LVLINVNVAELICNQRSKSNYIFHIFISKKKTHAEHIIIISSGFLSFHVAITVLAVHANITSLPRKFFFFAKIEENVHSFPVLIAITHEP